MPIQAAFDLTPNVDDNKLLYQEAANAYLKMETELVMNQPKFYGMITAVQKKKKQGTSFDDDDHIGYQVQNAVKGSNKIKVAIHEYYWKSMLTLAFSTLT